MTLRAVSVTSNVSTEQVAIGHDILSLISSAMYVEPMIIYRELIQNAADAIDDAIASGILETGEGRVNWRLTLFIAKSLCGTMASA